jgi:hypothetical protein
VITAPRACSYQDQFPEVCVSQHVDNIVHMRLQDDARVRQMEAFTQASERRRVHAVPVFFQQGNELLPTPAPQPGRMHQNKDSHPRCPLRY